VRKQIFLVILILIVAPGISKGATDVITDSEGESLFGLQDANYRFAGTDNGLRLAASKTESVQSSQSMAITSAAVTFNPKKKDKFTLKGTTGSLSLTGAQSVIFQAGSFSQEITLDKFTQSKQKYTFKGATGAAGIASLVLDLAKAQFSATVQNLFLAGFTNPLPITLKAGSTSECSMAQFSVSGNKWTFSTSNPQYACLITQVPVASPVGFFVNTSTNITIQAQVPSNANLNTNSIQLFQTDDSLNPIGTPLCALLDNGNSANGDQKAGDGIYSCIVSLQEATPGKVNLMVGAQLSGKMTYSPSFSLTVVSPLTQEEAQKTVDSHQKAGQKWQDNLAKYGDTKKARDQTVKAIKATEGVKDSGLSSDGSSVWIEFKSGIRGGIVLNPQTIESETGAALRKDGESSEEIDKLAKANGLNGSLNTPYGGSGSPSIVKNRSVRIFAPFTHWKEDQKDLYPLYKFFTGHTGEVQKGKFSVEMDVVPSGEEQAVVGLDEVSKLVGYGTVIMASPCYQGKYSPVILTTERAGLQQFKDEGYMLDFLTGCIEIWCTIVRGEIKSFIGFSPNFIATLGGNFNHSIIYFVLGAADQEGYFVKSFLKKESPAVFSYLGKPDFDHPEWSDWADNKALELFRLLAVQGKNTQEAYAALGNTSTVYGDVEFMIDPPLGSCAYAGSQSILADSADSTSDLSCGIGYYAPSATAGIEAFLNVYYDWHDPAVVNHRADGVFDFVWNDHYTQMTGTLANEVFSGTWDYTNTNGHFYGQMDITLDAGISTATKIVSFSASNNFDAPGVVMTQQIGGVDVPVKSKGATSIRFEADGAATCQSVTYFDQESADQGVTLSLTEPQCNSNSKVVIQLDLKLD